MRVGILGGGQLGRMLALAGYPLGLRFRFIDPSPEAPAGHLGDQVIARWDDHEALARFAEGLDVATWEFESVPGSAAMELARHVKVLPPPIALERSHDRLKQRELCAELGLPVPPHARVDSREDLERSASEIGLPAVLKTRHAGYDGKGQFVLREQADIERAWVALGGSPLTLEQFVPFERELSILSVRGLAGEVRFYPLVENRHEQGILRVSRAPAEEVAALQSIAETYARRILERLDYVGVMTIELFQHQGKLLVNEIAMRVHNSGHWTIEAAWTSQFENHLRAILGLPLGDCQAIDCSGMVNLIGTMPRREDVLAIPGAHLHLYGKEPRPGRKLGHVTLMGATHAEIEPRLATVIALAAG